MKVHDYNADAWGKLHVLFQGAPFVAIDPGKKGAAIVYGSTGGPSYGYLLGDIDQSAALKMRCHAEAISLVIIEMPFSARHAKSALELGFGMGLIVGLLSRAHVVRVYPATWQAYQRGGGKQLSRKDGITLAISCATPEIERLQAGLRLPEKLTKPYREGVASALGIGTWWREQVRDHE